MVKMSVEMIKTWKREIKLEGYNEPEPEPEE